MICMQKVSAFSELSVLIIRIVFPTISLSYQATECNEFAAHATTLLQIKFHCI